MSLSFIPKLESLSPHVFRVLGCNPGPYTLQGTNTYLVGNKQNQILIDSSSPDTPEYLSNLKDACTQVGCTLNDINTIICTHWHHDHVGGIKMICNERKSNTVRIIKFPRINEIEEKEYLPAGSHYQYFKDQQVVKVGNLNLRLLHTPGHTTDHMCIYLENDGTLFSGDCILGETTSVFEDLYDYMNSLNILLKYKIKRIYPGHGPVIENPVDKIEEYISHRNMRENQILQVIKKCGTVDLDKIVDSIYQGLSAPVRLGACRNVEHHLEKLVKEGQILRIDGVTPFWKSKL